MEAKSNATSSKEAKPVSQRMRRCAQWLVSQGAQPQQVDDNMPPLEDTKPSEDLVSIPAAVDEDDVKPRKVPPRKLRTHGLRMECDWRGCIYVTGDYDALQRHVRTHIPQLQVTSGPELKYKCLWDICHHQSTDGREMARHVNFHSYHSMLMAVGTSTKFNFKLPHCAKDSTKRNKVPVQVDDYKCRWVGCEESFSAIQDFFSHVHVHVQYCDSQCSWAGCGRTCEKYISQHIRPHIGEKVVACPHCGSMFSNNAKFRDHLERQKVSSTDALTCGVCGKQQATARLLRMHARQHVCVYACTFCDMTTQTISALSTHVRYRHLSDEPDARPFKCSLCKYSGVTKQDVRRHMATHEPKKKEQPVKCEVEEFLFKKPQKRVKRYICHMCPEGKDVVFSRGTRLTTHLVKKHGAQWPDGHCRFRYQQSEDGFYRLTTTRYESLEVSRQIMRGGTSPKETIAKGLKVKIKKKSSATSNRPTLFEIDFNAGDDSDSGSESRNEETKLERLKDILNEEIILKDELNNVEDETDNVMDEPDYLRSELSHRDEPNNLIDVPDNLRGESNNLSDELNNLMDQPKREPNIEIMMCDVDEDGNVLQSKVLDPTEIIIGI